MSAGLRLLVRGCIGRRGPAVRFGNVLKGDRAGACLFARGDNADLEAAGGPVDLETSRLARPRASVTAISVRRPFCESAARPFLGQVEADGGFGTGLPVSSVT